MNHIADGDFETFERQYKAQQEWMDTKRVLTPIDLPHAGETFYDPTLEAFSERLEYLRDLGYRFPDDVFDQIDDEIAERDRK